MVIGVVMSFLRRIVSLSESGEKDRVFMRKRDFHYLVLDEAHALKKQQRDLSISTQLCRVVDCY